MKTNNQICNKKHVFSKLSTDTHQILKLAHAGVKAFDDYLCTSVNVKKCILISYIANENDKICYTVQYIKVQDLYIFTMHSIYLLVNVTC